MIRISYTYDFGVASGFWIVDDFVAVEAPKLNRDRLVIRRWLQSFQHQSLAAYRIQ